MSQTAKFSFKQEVAPPQAKRSRKVGIVLAVVAVLVVACFCFQYLCHITRTPVAVSRVAPATTPAGASAVAPSSAKPAPSGLFETLMAVFLPSAKAETVQPETTLAKIAVPPAALPAARQPLPVYQAPVPTDEQNRLRVAQDSFNRVMDMANYNPDTFGFAANDRLDQARLAQPIRVYTIAASDRKNYQSGEAVKPLLQATNEWIFPVTLNDHVRFMIPVKLVDGEYVAEASSRSLAMVYAKIQDRWPVSRGFHPQLVVNPYIDSYYFTIPELPDQNLTDTSEMFEYNPTLSPATVILASWR